MRTAHADATASRRSALFATALGECGLAWQDEALVNVLLPAGDAAATRSLLRHLSGAEEVAEPWPPFVQEAVAGMQALLRGEAVSLAAVPLAWSRVGAFERRVYGITQRLAPGETSTYGDVARALGDPSAARAVGVALGRNPWPLVVPCHRVLAAGGKLGGFSAPGGVATKERLLAIEAPLARREGELF
ncbi:MAG: methylated-DNA--[protein]-cysteine S-methyltransferase [Burkholderiales bacterium]|nr:methylated-DNA--[protein]-cysteine S-methyltransferase [Burkholderiales bacterium]